MVLCSNIVEGTRDVITRGAGRQRKVYGSNAELNMVMGPICEGVYAELGVCRLRSGQNRGEQEGCRPCASDYGGWPMLHWVGSAAFSMGDCGHFAGDGRAFVLVGLISGFVDELRVLVVFRRQRRWA